MATAALKLNSQGKVQSDLNTFSGDPANWPFWKHRFRLFMEAAGYGVLFKLKNQDSGVFDAMDPEVRRNGSLISTVENFNAILNDAYSTLRLALDDTNEMNQRAITISKEGDFFDLYRNLKTSIEGSGHTAVARAQQYFEGLRLDSLDEWPEFLKGWRQAQAVLLPRNQSGNPRQQLITKVSENIINRDFWDVIPALRQVETALQYLEQRYAEHQFSKVQRGDTSALQVKIGKCTNCGKKGHLAKDCWTRRHRDAPNIHNNAHKRPKYENGRGRGLGDDDRSGDDGESDSGCGSDDDRSVRGRSGGNDGRFSNRGGGRGGSGHGRSDGGSGGGRDKGRASGRGPGGRFGHRDGNCWNCGLHGHFKHECPTLAMSISLAEQATAAADAEYARNVLLQQQQQTRAFPPAAPGVFAMIPNTTTPTPSAPAPSTMAGISGSHQAPSISSTLHYPRFNF